jgi:hypothetical protein
MIRGQRFGDGRGLLPTGETSCLIVVLRYDILDMCEISGIGIDSEIYWIRFDPSDLSGRAPSVL